MPHAGNQWGPSGWAARALELAQRPGEVVALQAAASHWPRAGWMGLYEALLARHGAWWPRCCCFTRGDFWPPGAAIKERLPHPGAAAELGGGGPIVNENDNPWPPMSCAFGDTTHLSALVSRGDTAPMKLVLLTDVTG